MAYLFFDEFGVEPLGFVGYPKEVIDLTVEDALHGLYGTTSEILSSPVVASAYHRSAQPTIHPVIILTDNISAIHSNLVYHPGVLGQVITVHSAIHGLYQFNQLNAPVSFTCRTYLQTPYENRILETPIVKC